MSPRPRQAPNVRTAHIARCHSACHNKAGQSDCKADILSTQIPQMRPPS